LKFVIATDKKLSVSHLHFQMEHLHRTYQPIFAVCVCLFVQVSSGEAPASMHDEFAQLLVEGLPFDNDADMKDVNHAVNDIEPRDSDREAVMLYKIYRRKLQNFLLNSQDYHPARVLKFLPPQYMHENALVLSRMGQHEEVLRIYVRLLQDLKIAENYCGRIYKAAVEFQAASGTFSQNRTGFVATSATTTTNSLSAQFENGTDIYLTLFKVLLDTESEDTALESSGSAHLKSGLMTGSATMKVVIALAETYFDRFDASAFMDLLPPSTPVQSLLRFLQIVIEFNNTKKRNLKVCMYLTLVLRYVAHNINSVSKHSFVFLAFRSLTNCYE
jgi:hypothetical protein